MRQRKERHGTPEGEPLAAPSDLEQPDMGASFTRAVLEAQQAASRDGVLVVDQRGRILYFNQRFLDMWSLPAEVVRTGSDEAALEAVHNQLSRPEEFFARVRELYAHPPERSRDEIDLIDGTTLERVSAPAIDARGMHYGRVWVFRDISERKRAERALRESELRYRQLVDMANEGVWVLNAEGRTTFANAHLAAMLGVTPDQMTGQSPEAFMFPSDLSDHANRLHRRWLGEPEVYERRFRHRDGRSVWTIVSAAPLFRAARAREPQAVMGSVAMVTDITQRKQAEQALEEERRLFMGGPTVVFEWGVTSDWPVHYVSPNVKEQFGYEPSELTRGASPYAHLIHPEDLPRVEQELQRCVDEGRTLFQQEYRLRRADGEYRWVNEFTVVMRDSCGRAISYRGYVLDVTARRRAEEALQDSERKLRGAVDGSPVPQFLISRDHRVLYWNHALETLTGIRAADVVGTDRHWAAVYASKRPTIADFLADGATELIPQFYPGKFVLSRTLPDTCTVTDCFSVAGRERWLQVTAAAIRDGRGNIVAAIETIEDITERKQAEKERNLLLHAERIARLDAEHAGRMRDEFLATVSHEIRTPLNAILGWTQLLLNQETLLGSAGRGLTVIERNARSLARLIEDLLDTSRIIAGTVRLDTKQTGLNAVIEAAMEAVKPSADDKQIHLESTLDPSAGVVVGDPTRLQQIVWNLLSNGIKFTPAGGRVTVSSRGGDGQVEIEVRDTGIGIKPDFRAHLFERFRQADSSTTRRHGGLGLGLAIVRHLVDLHGGRVEASSEGENRGACFRVLLPRGAVDTTALESQGHAAQSLPATELAGRLAGLRVLVVDDDADARELAVRILHDYRAKVEAVGSAAEALARVDDWSPDVMVCDIAMPIEDGYSLLRKVRALPHERGGDVPALALTALAGVEDKNRALSSGFQAHLAKPFDPSELAMNVALLTRRMDGHRAFPGWPARD